MIATSLVPSPFVAATYVPLHLSELISLYGGDDALFRKQVSLMAQGENVEVLEENDDVSFAMVAFDVLSAVCPEVVLRTREGNRVLLFDESNGRMLRPDDIVTGLLDEKTDEATPEIKRGSVTIDVSTLWKAANGEDEVARLKQSIQKFRKQIPCVEKVTIIGDYPLALVLLIQYALHGRVKEIWHQSTATSQAKKIHTMALPTV